MRIVLLTHALTSCWNHGNAHFLRGVAAELAALGHSVAAFEPASGWSRDNLLRDHGPAGLARSAAGLPAGVTIERYGDDLDLGRALGGADVVIVHEWTQPRLVAAIGRARRHARFTLLFHDTHHRAVSDPGAMRALALDDYDAVLAFGASLAEVWQRRGLPTLVWHEAADTRLFRPPADEGRRDGVVFVGNWGDDERSREIVDMLLAPAAATGLQLDVHGVRYPEPALAALGRHGARFRGWLPNPEVPGVLARRLATVHVPRRFYVERLPGIPTIRVFEALACGIPLLSARWDDAEGLFRPGRDYLVASTGVEMERHLRELRDDPALRRSLARSGLETIRARHTCRHRALELLDHVRALRGAAAAPLRDEGVHA